jgi:hypothetical protein
MNPQIARMHDKAPSNDLGSKTSNIPDKGGKKVEVEQNANGFTTKDEDGTVTDHQDMEGVKGHLDAAFGDGDADDKAPPMHSFGGKPEGGAY